MFMLVIGRKTRAKKREENFWRSNNISLKFLIMKCCGKSNKLQLKECEFLNQIDENEEFL